MEKLMIDYGKEVIIDLHNCNSKLFTRGSIRKYFKQVCKLIDMKRCKLCWWDDLHTPEEEKETKSYLAGTSAVQFITTSNITIHALNILCRVYLNIFSCKDFDENAVIEFSKNWFEGEIASNTVIRRV